MQAADEEENFERRLRSSVYRFDCPSAQTLGEYELDLVGPEDRTRIAGHVLECSECREDLETLRSFLVAPVTVAEPVLDRVRRVVATLFVPRPGLAYSGLRGSAETSTRIYNAGDITVSIAPGPAAGSLIGLVAGGEPLTDREVRLLPREGSPMVTRVDDLGNFEFEGVAAGTYALEIELPDGVLVIEELPVD